MQICIQKWESESRSQIQNPNLKLDPKSGFLDLAHIRTLWLGTYNYLFIVFGIIPQIFNVKILTHFINKQCKLGILLNMISIVYFIEYPSSRTFWTMIRFYHAEDWNTECSKHVWKTSKDANLRDLSEYSSRLIHCSSRLPGLSGNGWPVTAQEATELVGIELYPRSMSCGPGWLCRFPFSEWAMKQNTSWL